MDRSIKLGLAVVFYLAITNLSGCGGGGGGADVVPSPAPTATRAVIALGTTLPAASTEQIGSVDVSFELPSGVTLALAAGAIPTGSGGVVNLSGEATRFAALSNANASILGNYTPATISHKATVIISVVTILNNNNSTQSMNAGEFATLACNITPGATIDLATMISSSVLIGNAAGIKLYDTLGGVTGPASATYKVTLYDSSDNAVGSPVTGRF